MNVKRAVDIFSPAVSSALIFLEIQAGKSDPVLFADTKLAIIFPQKVYKRFSFHNINDKYKHIQLADPDSKQFEDPNDERLAWLIEDFFYHTLNPCSFPFSKVSMLTKETIEAIKLTSHSTSLVIKYLLIQRKFECVNRRFSSDAVKGFFRALRQSSGCHYQMPSLPSSGRFYP